jgi:flavodoxin
MTHRLDRRRFLRAGAATATGVMGGAWLMACGEPEPAARPSTPDGARVLLTYFSRAGENYHYGGRKYLETGNTEVLARMISDSIACDVHRIEAAEPYPDDYEDAVDRNVREQDADARPAIANSLPDLTGYDVVLLGSGLWNVRPPMIMRTFTDSLDFTGKTVLPVVTYAVSGLGNAPDEYTDACPGATIGDGLAVRGEEVNQARDAVSSWLRRAGLT